MCPDCCVFLHASVEWLDSRHVCKFERPRGLFEAVDRRKCGPRAEDQCTYMHGVCLLLHACCVERRGEEREGRGIIRASLVLYRTAAFQPAKLI